MVNRANLHLLIIIWWIGAALAGIALLLPVYGDFFIVGVIGWATVVVSTSLLIYEIRRIRKEDKERQNELA